MGDPGTSRQAKAAKYGECGQQGKVSINWNRLKKVLFSKTTGQVAAACILGVVVIGGSISYFNYKKAGYEVKYDGKIVGYVRDKSVALEALNSVKEKVKKKDSTIYVSDDIDFDNVLVSDEKITSEGDIEQVLSSGIHIDEKSYAITVNGKDQFYVATEDEAKKVIDGIKNYFKDKEAKDGVEVVDVKIKDDIGYEKKVIDSTVKTVDVKTAVDALTGEKGLTKKYEVKQGDTVWNIARDNSMKIQEIQNANPGINLDKLQIGQVVNLSVSEPYLNVETTVKATFDENIPFGTKYVSDSNLYKGQSKVVESGKYGINRVVRQITKLNGREIANSVLSAAVVKSPVAQVLAQGTKLLVGTGQFAWPTGGHLTSGFGSRGRSFHKGIDIASPTGTPIYAADGGTVTHAGWSSGYGKLIIISHGNGYETYYGHCSSISVSVGQSVSRGQYIGAVGHTGNAYGSHVHFEIRLNGTSQNPLKYLK